MDDLIVWPSKKVIDLITLEYDLFDQLPVGVTIVSVTVSSLVFQGFTDIAAASMLYLPPVIHNSLIQQKVRNGIPGNVYNIRFDIILSDGQEWIKTFRLAITPNNTPAVPIAIPLYFTSRPYPYNYLEDMTPTSKMVSGGFLFSPSPKEFMTPICDMQFGSLQGTVFTYPYSFEDMTPLCQMQSGMIQVVLHSYSYGFEDLTPTSQMRSGTIAVIVVSYNYSFEDLQPAAKMQSGTLV